MSNGAARPAAASARQAWMAEPGLSPAGGRGPAWLRGRRVLNIERTLPPLGLFIRLVRLALPPRFRGEATIPRGPWGLMQGGILLTGLGALVQRRLGSQVMARALEAATSWCSGMAAAVASRAQGPEADGFARVSWGVLDHALRATAAAMHWLATHIELMSTVVTIYLMLLGASLLVHAGDRVRTRHEWLRCCDLLHRVRQGVSWTDNRRYAAHVVANVTLPIWALLAVAWAWWPFEPAYGSWFRRSLVASFVPYPLVQDIACLGLVVALVLLLARRLLVRLAARHPFGTWLPPSLPLEEAATPTAMPQLSVDGRIAVPQLRPGSPLTVRACDLDTMSRGVARRFATLFAMGLAGDCRYEPDGNRAGPTRWDPSVLAAVDAAGIREPGGRERGEFRMPMPGDLVVRLCRLMYVAAGVDGSIGRQANAVVRNFCSSHSLACLVPEEELAHRLKGLADEDWPRRTPLESAAFARTEIDGLAVLPPIQQYISQWFEHSGGHGVRHCSGWFDPLRNGAFQDANLKFDDLARLLLQAVIYADRRIESAEDELIRELGLAGDFDDPKLANSPSAAPAATAESVTPGAGPLGAEPSGGAQP